MRFADPGLQTALTAWRALVGITERAEADNLWFEDRVNVARQQTFEARAAGARDAGELRRRHTDYWKEYVTVDEDIAHTFDAALGPADLAPIDEAQRIVRLEDLSRPLSRMGRPMSLQRLKQAIADNETALVDAFLRVWDWSNVRDWRPCFATFKDEVRDDLARPDWSTRLRDRLGLAHYNCVAGPVPVALMEYSVGEVIAAARAFGASCAVTAPTVFDSGPWPHFFPAPRKLPCGRAMALVEVNDDGDMLAELLHFRLSYKRHHIVRLDEITSSPAPYDLKSLRNHHLLAVQMASDCYDFGEEIP
jgi:hypothetical protein